MYVCMYIHLERRLLGQRRECQPRPIEQPRRDRGLLCLWYWRTYRPRCWGQRRECDYIRWHREPCGFPSSSAVRPTYRVFIFSLPSSPERRRRGRSARSFPTSLPSRDGGELRDLWIVNLVSLAVLQQRPFPSARQRVRD